MAHSMENKVALVTGGSSGIGRASALAFAAEGAKVVIADMDVKGGEETVDLVKKAGSDAIFVKTDVSKAAQVKAMADATVDTYGRLDYAFNNAGIDSTGKTIVELTEENWDRVISINLKGVWLSMKYEIPFMLKQGKGAIVNNSSTSGLVGFPNLSDYTASKHGVVGLTKSLAVEYAKLGIRVNAVCPGTTITPLVDRIISNPKTNAWIIKAHPIGRLGVPEEVASAVVWLCSDGASFVTGQCLAVDGGYVAQ